jgi:hypothetical protein
MGHFILLVIIPKEIYEKGIEEIDKYIFLTLIPYHENIACKDYIKQNKEEVTKQFIECKYNYETLQDFCQNELYKNYNGLYDWYEIGGRWDCEFTNIKSVNENSIEGNLISVKSFLELNDNKISMLDHIIDIEGNYYKENNFRNILEVSKEHYLVNIDCHI